MVEIPSEVSRNEIATIFASYTLRWNPLVSLIVGFNFELLTHSTSQNMRRQVFFFIFFYINRKLLPWPLSLESRPASTTMVYEPERCWPYFHGHHVISNAKYGCKNDNYALTRLIVEAGVIRILEYSDRKQYKLEFEAAM